ncbi:MAG TPA: TonB-dependent receptor, partial [Bryobacteraceae bacterium]|nr:TonB-dependent receptor [Bryobacteraceae bacterium]
ADSEQAFASGASVNVMLKSGSNSTHGAAYIYNIDNYFTANNFFAPAGSKPAHNIDNDTGGNIGGHVIKNKLFYFGGYEGDYTRASDSGIVSIPRQRELSGDFSQSPNPVYDPRTGGTGSAVGTGRTAFPGNQIPTSRVSPVIQKLIPFIPKNNIDGVVNNYYLDRPTLYNLHKIDTKVDYTATQKLRFSGRWGYQPYYNFQGAIYGDTLGGSGSVGNSQSGAGNYLQNGATMGLSGSGTYVMSPSFIIDGTFGVTQGHQLLFPNLTNVRYGSDVLNIPGTNVGPLPWAGGVPNFIITGFQTMGYSYPALEYKDPIFEYSVNATKIKGKHSVRFGIDIQREHQNHIETSPTAFTFSGGPTIVNGGPAANNYNNLATFLLGLPTTETNYIQYVQPYLTLRTWEFALYMRDQWQLTRKLTLQYGVRWEKYPVPTQENRGITQYDFATNTTTVCGQGGQPMDCGISTSNKLFAPNIGVAYRMLEKFVIRAGYSISPIQDNMARGAFKSYPDNAAATINAPNPTAFSWAGDIVQGLPVIPAPTLVNGKTLVPPNTGNLSSQNSKTFIRGYVQTYNLTLQKEFTGGWIGQVGYLGTHGVKLNSARNFNYGQLGGGPASQPLFPYGITSAVSINHPATYSHYNALQATLRKRMSYGLTLNLAYTFSKYISHPINVAIPQYDYLNNGVLDGSDRPHSLVITSGYEIPFGKGKQYFKSGPAAAILGGWNLGGVFDHHSGSVFSIGANSTSCNCPGSTQRVDLIKPSVDVVGSGIGGEPYFDPSAFAQVTDVRFGTLGYNTLRGPGSTNLDMNLIRNVRVTERISVQLRAEALNISNTKHLGNPGTSLANASFNTDGSVKNLGGFSQITSTSNGSRLIDSRYFRFGLRIIF